MAKKEPKSNKIILGITYIGAALFLGLAGYMGYFLQVQSENVINNSYNARLDSFANRVVRGLPREERSLRSLAAKKAAFLYLSRKKSQTVFSRVVTT